MQTLRQVLENVTAKKVAVGHFNVSDLAAFNAICAAARELNLPVMVGVSEGEREFVGVKQVAALVKAARDEGLPIYLNADHTHSLEKIKEAAEAGFDEVLFDGSKLSFEENVKQTAQAVQIAKSINPEIIVEGELGYIGSSSEIVDKVPEESLKHTTVEEAKQFIEETKIDVLAPAVGNMHGLLASMVSGDVKKRLDIQRIVELHASCGIFMTLHGGSGTADEDFMAAVKAGITIVHVNTEIRLAWRRGVERGLADNPKELAPYKILPAAVEEIVKVVKNRLQLFSRQ